MGHTPGRIATANGKNGILAARLFNFDIGKHELKKEHKDWLKAEVVGRLQSGGSMFVVGLASRTDTDAHNMVLSRRRADALIQFLRKESPNNFKIALDIALGERAAQFAGVRDGHEDENWRAVALSVWNRRDPPPMPVIPTPPPPPLVEVRSFVEFLTEQKIRGGTGDDPPGAVALNDLSMNLAQSMWGGNTFMKEVKRRVPATYKVIEVLALRNSNGSELGIAAVSITSCQVAYKWGMRTKPCLLINGYWRTGPYVNSDPTVYRMSDDQADMWVDTPFKALKSLDDWNLPALSYDDYRRGKL